MRLYLAMTALIALPACAGPIEGLTPLAPSQIGETPSLLPIEAIVPETTNATSSAAETAKLAARAKRLRARAAALKARNI